VESSEDVLEDGALTSQVMHNRDRTRDFLPLLKISNSWARTYTTKCLPVREAVHGAMSSGTISGGWGAALLIREVAIDAPLSQNLRIDCRMADEAREDCPAG